MGEIQRDPELNALWSKEFLSPFLGKMEGVYQTLSMSGRFRPLEPALATRAIGGFILGFLMLKVMEGDGSPLNHIPQNEVADILASFVLYGLAMPTRKEE